MSLEIEVLEYLSTKKPTLKYKGIRVGLFGLPDFKYYKYQTFANRLSSGMDSLKNSSKNQAKIAALCYGISALFVALGIHEGAVIP